ncbi:MAG: RnfABCDGE type electron transport complex subunit D, partial [Rodentibacter sp.]
PLDSAKIFYKSHTELNDFYQLVKMPIFMGNGTDFAQGWWQVNLAFLVGGLFLVLKRTIHWQIPVAMLFTFFCLASTTALAGGTHLSAVSQMFSGAMMFGAFFIATDPVTASITPRGKILFGALVGLFVYLIRYHGNFPDGVAFAVLLSNICVPLIDHYTRPRVAGYQTKGIK